MIGLKKANCLKSICLSACLASFPASVMWANPLGEEIEVLSVNMQNKTLKEVFSYIEKHSDYVFIYQASLVDLNGKTTVRLEEQPVIKILDEALSGTGLSYTVRGRQIIIKKEVRKVPEVILPEIAQQKKITVKGNVKDGTGFPLAGVNVVVKGTSQGIMTDVDGNFILENVDPSVRLDFSYIGFKPMEVPAEEMMALVMREDNEQLNEIVVVGYGVQKKANLTGAVDKIDSKALSALQVNTMAEALQGQIPNLNVDVADGKPGRPASFNIRGTTSINGGAPLIIIDEVASTSEELNNLSPKDIEEISVLKDAASAAIYGARGTYGVILITTKRAKAGDMQVSYSNNFGWSKATRIMDLYNAPDYASIINDFASNIGQSFFTSSQVNYFEQSWTDSSLPAGKYQKEGGTLFGNQQHNFYKEWLREFTPRQNHHINILGGGDKFKYFLSGDFNHEEGNIEFKPDKIDRYSMRSNVTYDINNHISIFNNTSFLYRKDDLAYTNVYSWISNIYRYIECTNPYVPETMDVNGTEMFTDAGYYRKFVSDQSSNVTKLNQFSTTLGFNISLLGKDLRIHGDFTYKHSDSNNLVWTNLTGPLLYLYSNNNAICEVYPNGNSEISRTMNNMRTTYVNVYGTYDKLIDKQHHVTFMVGFNREDNAFFAMTGSRSDPFLVDQHSLNLASGNAVITESDDQSASQSAFFRANYNFNERYLLEVNGCYNVSSKFPQGQRDAMFFSVSGGWRASEEAFFEPLKETINNLKIRASYGALGNQNVGSYDYLSIMSMRQTSYTLEGERVNYTSSPAPKSPNFTWEKAETVDVGLDFSLLNNRLSFSGDFYQRDTKNMLAKFHSLPSVFGATVPKENNAKLRTKGWEASVHWSDAFKLSGKDFNYGVRFGISDYTSKILEYYNPTNYLDDYYVGQTIGEIWGLENDGYYKTDEEAMNGAHLTTSWNKNYERAGCIKFKDVDNDGQISKGLWTLDNHGDFKVIGNTTPRYQYSFTLNASWYGFDVNAFFKGVAKRDIFPDGASVAFWGPYSRKYMLMPDFVGQNIWTPENPDAYFPRPQAYIAGDNGLDLSFPQTKYLQNAAYLRLKNLTVGYTLPRELTRKIKVDRLRVYFTGQNLFEATKLNSSLDPEGLEHDPDASASVGMGTAYPVQRTYSFGLELQF